MGRIRSPELVFWPQRLRGAGHDSTVPVPSLGTQFDSEYLRVAIALRVHVTVCGHHKCWCGRMMVALGHHGLLCRFSAVHSQRHTALNNVVKHALHGAGVPSVLEPLGFDCGDSTYPDGLSIVPKKNGRSPTWDCTCIDMFAESHITNTAIMARAAGHQCGKHEVPEIHKPQSVLYVWAYCHKKKKTVSMANQCRTLLMTMAEGSKQPVVIADNWHDSSNHCVWLSNVLTPWVFWLRHGKQVLVTDIYFFTFFFI